jgi:hypothetical protein
MNSWAPIWSMIVDSSLWDEPYHVRLLFITMLALKDADNIVRYDGYLLGKKAHITPEECLEAMSVLSSPDTKRQAFECLEKQEFDGRRIEKVDGGWLILNGPKYRSMIQKMKNRGYKTEWQFKKRHEGRKVAVPVAVEAKFTRGSKAYENAIGEGKTEDEAQTDVDLAKGME